MHALSHHQFQFAPPVSSPGACAKGGRRSPLLASAATLSIIDNQHQTDSHSRGGAPLGLRCDYRPAVGRIHGRGLFLAARGYDLPDYHLAEALIGFGHFSNLRRQPRRQAHADLPKRHFKLSVINAPNLDRGEHDEIHEHSTSGEANDC